jgi:hypothetical protein
MTEDRFSYQVKCRTCRTRFKVQLFESHEKNLFLVDKKDWYCDACKKKFALQQTAKLSAAHQSLGLPTLTGSPKMLTWAEKIRAELINKVNYLKQNTQYPDSAAQAIAEKAFERFLEEWQGRTRAQWWIDHRRMTVKDIADRIAEISESLEKS